MDTTVLLNNVKNFYCSINYNGKITYNKIFCLIKINKKPVGHRQVER